MKQYLSVLDRAAAQVNVFLMVIAVALGMLDMTVLVGTRMMAAVTENMPAMQDQISASGELSASSQPTATHP
jgi:hypothetical protein